MIQHISIQVTGKVQGVYYRATAAETARKIGLTGWVMNMPDGAVYMEAEGTEEQLDEFIAWCRQGPGRAEVTDVQVKPAAVKGFADFTIRR